MISIFLISGILFPGFKIFSRPQTTTVPLPSALCCLCLIVLATIPGTSLTLPHPVHLTADQDHQRTLDLLQITSLRRGPVGDPNSPYAANFDESKVGLSSPLPDPLVLERRKEGHHLPKSGPGSAARKLSNTSTVKSSVAFLPTLPRSTGKSGQHHTTTF